MNRRRSQFEEAPTASPSRRRLRMPVAACLLSILGALFVIFMPSPADAQQYPGVGCTATLENRSALVDDNGTYTIPNVPAVQGQYKIHIVCPQPDGSILDAWSSYYSLLSAPSFAVPLLPLDVPQAQPASLNLQIYSGQLTAVGATLQLATIAVYVTGGEDDVTLGSAGTTYISSNPAVATVSADGLVTATGAGQVSITANNNGLTTTIIIPSFASLDSDGDGMPDAWEIANGLNPYDPTDANLDPDGDGLTNLQEYLLGTNPHNADTDGDGVPDGQEVAMGTNPLVADTDGDGLTDGQELALGTNPLNPDTDGDGIPDGIEVKIGTNPLVPDVTTSVTGHVTNPDGTPASSVSVVILTWFTALTDSTGAFTILHVPITLGNITASAEEIVQGKVYSGASQATAGVGNGVTDVGTISLGQNAGQVSGTITTPDNKPAAGVQVVVSNGADSRSMFTDSTGLYSVSGLPAGIILVAAVDPTTSLRGQATGTLSAGDSLTLNLQLAPFGTVSGTVLNVGGQAVGAGVPVTITGALNTSTTTDALGRYSFSFVPLGSVALDATDSNGNHGHTTATITATAQVITANIQYLGRGTVSGVVSDSGGTPVAGAAVHLSNNGLFYQAMSTVTNSVGQYSFSGVFVGSINLSATSTATSTGGSASTNITADGQNVTANITLMPSANISGTVFRSNGTTPVAGASVHLSNNAFLTTTAADGTYSFSNVPLGNFTITATDAASNDRGQTSINLTTSGQTFTGNINMVGLGTVNVTVQDGGGTPSSGSVVQLNTNSPFYQSLSGVSASDGTVSFTQVLASSFHVTATNQQLSLSGAADGTLAATGTTSIAVRLQPAGTVQGTVYLHDGSTPLAGITVRAQQAGNTLASAITGANGSYTLINVPSGTSYVAVFDSVGNTLSFNSNVVITTQGQVVTANFVIEGRGTVTGRVTNPDGSAAPAVAVQVTSGDAGDGVPYGTSTDINGNYTIALVPVGGYNVVAQQHTLTTNSYGTASGALASDGATSVTNVVLSTSLVPTSLSLSDANAEQYAIRENGGIFNGSFGVFSGDSAQHQGASLLSIVAGGTPTQFTGEDFAPVDQSGRQISITQNNLDGLNITRRVYVPVAGYFARYIELLSNPTASDITIGVQLNTNFRAVLQDIKLNGATFTSTSVPQILSTSSGDNTLNINDPTSPDHWVTFAGQLDQDPFIADEFYEFPIPTVADVFDGPGASLLPTSAVYNTDASGAFSTLTETFGSVTVPAGATVGILHFLSQQNLYASGNASATRLDQLPPEALAGISSVDLGSIANFVIPAGGNSTVPPLPSITNQVTGTVYAGDGTTPILSAIVHLQSTDPIYSRTYIGAADGSGVYSFQGSFGGMAIPAENFNVLAFEPNTSTPLTPDCAQYGNFTTYGCAIISPISPGSFAVGATTGSADITFSNTGILNGTISRGPTVLNVAGTVTLSGGPMSNITVPIQADGTYSFLGVLPGNYNVEAFVTNTLLTGLTTTAITAGQVTTTNITIIESGNITGLVTRPGHSLAVGDVVNLRVANQPPVSVAVDTSGHYAFTDVPIGSYTVDCFDPLSNTAASATATVLAGFTTTLDLALQSSGGVRGNVSVTDGSSLANITVTLTSTTSNGTQTLNTSTDANGGFSFSNVTPGTISVHAVNYEGLQGTGYGSLPLAGQTVTINVNLVAAGNLQGTVFLGDGTTPAPGIQLTLNPAPLTGSAVILSDAGGNYSYANVPLGGFTVYASNKATGDLGQASGQIQTIGQLRTINVTLNGFGNLTITVKDPSGNLVSGAALTVVTGNTGNQYTGTTGVNGTAAFNNIFAGPFTVTAIDPVSGYRSQSGGTLGYNANMPFTVTLQSLGTIQGTIYSPDGVTPQSGAIVQISGSSSHSATTGADGTFQFANIPTGYYSIRTLDANSVVRATPSSYIQLQSSGSVLTQNLTWIGVGTVSGKVVDTDGVTPLENHSISITSQNPTIGGTQNGTTGGDGTYSFSEVPVGRFTVNVNNLPTGEIGYATGSIDADSGSATANIQVQGNSINLPITLTDADGFSYVVYANGDYYGTAGSGGLIPFGQAGALTVNSSSGSGGFGSGNVAAIQSLNGQQIELTQPIGSLTVTRKVYVPTNGYFARRLDVLTNPTNAPITATVFLGSGAPEREGKNVSPQIITTSNGNKTINNSILWVVDDDDPGNVPYPQTAPAVAEVIAGPSAPTTLSAASNTINGFVEGFGNNQYSLYIEYAVYTFQTVTVPANSSVSFLFFTAQEATQGTAESAAARLDQLPPEALSGLSTADLASVVNFVIPTSQTLTPVYPPPPATLSGHVYAGDDVTPIPNATVYAQSTDLEFGAGATTTADGSGAYTLTNFAADSYMAEAREPVTTLTSAAVTGAFASGSTVQTQDIPFTNTGIVQGLIQPTGQTTIYNGNVYAGFTCNGGYCGQASANFGSTGAFTFLTVPAGSANFYINVYTSPLGGYYLSQGIGINAGQINYLTLTIPATGSIQGTVFNADGTISPGAGVGLYPASTGFYESTTTDINGYYAFGQVALDNYSITATDPITKTQVTQNTTVTQDTTSTVNLTFNGRDTVNATVHYANGNVGVNVQLEIFVGSGTNPYAYATTDSNGQASFTNVPDGSYSIRAFYPGQNFYSTTTGTLTGNNLTVPVAITLTPVGTISGKLTYADGTPASGAYVSAADNVSIYGASAQTDSAGNFAFSPVPADRVINVYSYNNTNNTTGKTIEAYAGSQQIPGDGQTLTVNLRYPGLANVQITLLKGDGTVDTTANRYLYMHSINAQQSQSFSGYLTSGTLTFNNVVESNFAAYVVDDNNYTGYAIGSTLFTVGASDDGTTKQVTVKPTPTGTLQGQVYASDGVTPLQSGWAVQFTDIDTTIGMSQSSGNPTGYQFTSVAAGASGFTLVPSFNNTPYPALTFNGTITSQGQVVTHDFTLPVSTVSGTVYLNDGVTPVPYASVSGVQVQNGSNHYFNATADANGNYQIAGALTGSMNVLAYDDSDVVGSVTINLPADNSIVTGVNISLGPVGTVIGTFYDANSSPVANAEVDLQSSGNNGGFFTSAQTDDDGNYQITDVPVGNITVTGDLPDGSSVSNTGTLNNNGDVVTIVLGTPPVATTGIIFGTVYDQDQNPASGATVTAIPDSTGQAVTATTDDNGMYTIAGLPAGGVTVSAVLNDGSTDAGTTVGSIADVNTPVEIDIGLQNYGDVSGIIYDVNNNPYGNVQIGLTTTADPNSLYVENTGDDGSYDFGGIDPGAITIYIYTTGDWGNPTGTATGTLPYGGNVVINATDGIFAPTNMSLLLRGPVSPYTVAAVRLQKLSPPRTTPIQGRVSAPAVRGSLNVRHPLIARVPAALPPFIAAPPAASIFTQGPLSGASQ